MKYPDQLKRPVAPRHRGLDDLDGFLWEAAAWDPDAERVLDDAYRNGADPELTEVVRRLLAEHVLTEPAMVSVALRVLAEAAALRADTVEARLERSAGIGCGRGVAAATQHQVARLDRPAGGVEGWHRGRGLPGLRNVPNNSRQTG